jgi:hypothetical protein
MRFGCPKYFVNDETVATSAVKDKPACQIVVRISLPGPQLLAPIGNPKYYGVITGFIIHAHVNAIGANGLVRFYFGGILEGSLPLASANRLYQTHLLIQRERKISGKGDIDRSSRTDSAASENLDPSPGLVTPYEFN